MAPQIDTSSAKVRDSERRLFVRDIESAFELTSGLGAKKNYPPFEVKAVLTSDLEAEVRRHLSNVQLADPEQFTVERAGGVVAAKTLPLKADYSEVLLVFASDPWEEETEPNSENRALQLSLILHEMAHALIERSAYAAGAARGRDLVWTANEVAEMIAHSLIGEYRANVIGDAVMGALVSASNGGVARKLTSWDLIGTAVVDALSQALTRAYPSWADVVQSYRKGAIPLEQMWGQTWQGTFETLTLLVHATAMSDAADRSYDQIAGVLEASRAYQLYLVPTWPDLHAIMKESAALPALEDIPEVEDRAVRVATALILGVWERLGITAVPRDDRALELEVSAPLR